MKKFLATISSILTAIVLAVFLVPGIIGSESVSAEQQTAGVYGGVKFESSMVLEYAEDTLVGVDGNGNVYRAESGVASDLEKTGTRLASASLANSAKLKYQDCTQTTLLAYGNKTLVYIGSESGSIVVFTSIDQGKTWSKQTTLFAPGAYSNTSTLPYKIIYGNDAFYIVALYFTDKDQELAKFDFFKSANGEAWERLSLTTTAQIDVSFAGGYFFQIQAGTSGYVGKYSTDFTTWETLQTITPSQVADIYSTNNPAIAKVNNAFVLVGAGGDVWASSVLDSEWTFVGDCGQKNVKRVVPFEDGAIVCTNNSAFKIKIESGKLQVVESYDYYFKGQAYRDTAVFSSKRLTIGGSNLYAFDIEIDDDSPLGADSASTANFITINRNVLHTVDFRDYNNALLSSVEVADGKTVSVPASPIRAGHTFDGWLLNGEGDVVNLATLAITADTTFVAKYTANNYTVTFKTDTGETLQTLQIPYGTKVPEEKIPTPTKDGHQFLGWDKSLDVLITADTTFVAQFNQKAFLTINYPAQDGTFGLIGQFKKTSITQKVIEYTIGDEVFSDELTAFLDSIKDWTNDFDDGSWDYDVRFLGWENLPTHINQNIEISAKTEKLNLVCLEYYSQLNFAVAEGSEYYYTFIAYMKIERLVKPGEVINVEDFKRSDVEYELYNARGGFFNNLNGFEFVSWSGDITAPITEDTTFVAEYEMPTFEIRYYDGEDYMIDETHNELEFLGLSALLNILNTNSSNWDFYKNMFRNMLTLKWGQIGDDVAERLDLAQYIGHLAKYNDMSTQLLTPFVAIDSDRPGIYDGTFMNGSVNVNSAVLQYFTGAESSHNLTYWISPVMFSTSLYPFSASVTYKNILSSTLKTMKGIWSSIWSVLKKIFSYIWKLTIMVVIIAVVLGLLYIFKDSFRKKVNTASKATKSLKAQDKSTKEQLKNSKKDK